MAGVSDDDDDDDDDDDNHDGDLLPKKSLSRFVIAWGDQILYKSNNCEISITDQMKFGQSFPIFQKNVFSRSL